MAETQEAPALISVPEAAVLAACSKVHLYRLVQRGEVEAIRVGDGHGPIRIPADSFTAWLYAGSRASAMGTPAQTPDARSGTAAKATPQSSPTRRAGQEER